MALCFFSTADDPEEWRTELLKLVPDLDFRLWPDIGDASEVDVALVWRAPADLWPRLPNLKAILSLGVGVDHVLGQPGVPAVPVARLVDDHCKQSMAEHVLSQVLQFHRFEPTYRDQQRQHLWKALPTRIARDCRVGIMGLGELGQSAASLLSAVGFRVSGWSRKPKAIAGVLCFAGNAELESFLNTADYLICLLALTPATEGILDARTFAALPRGAHVINCARGKHLVDEDLLAALASGHLAGAALDVFRTEPLPESHPFWTHPKVNVTPHAATGTNAPSAARHVAENLRRVRVGEPLLNVVDPALGY